MYRHQIVELTLKNLPSDATDERIASAIADYLIAMQPPGGLVKLTVDHDGSTGPCPVIIDRVNKAARTCTLERHVRNPREAENIRMWIIRALTHGLSVSRLDATRSIKSQREYIEGRERMAAWRMSRGVNGDVIDDEIPF